MTQTRPGSTGHHPAYTKLLDLMSRIGLTRNTLLERLAEAGFIYSDTDFANWGHPDPSFARDWNLLRAIVQILVLACADEQRCTATDALQLFALAGMPLHELREMGDLFPAPEFGQRLDRVPVPGTHPPAPLPWYPAGSYAEGRQWGEPILARTTLSDAARAKALDEAAGWAWGQGDYARARSLAQQSLALCQALALPSTLPPVTLCRWDARHIAHWPQDGSAPAAIPAARAVLVSPLAEPLTPFDTVLPSWRATTPPGTWIELYVQALLGTRWTRPYCLGAWDTTPAPGQRRSFDAQRDADGAVATETFQLNEPARAVQARVVLCAERADTLPTLDQLTLCLSARSHAALRGARHDLSSAPVQVAEPLNPPAFSQYAYPGGAGWCSPTALGMVLGYWYQRTGDSRLQPFIAPECVPNLIVPQVDDPAYGCGNWAFNTAYAATLGLEAYLTQLLSLHQMAGWVAAGVPVICSLAWEPGDLSDAPIPRSDGHLLVVCGMRSDGQVLVADPAGADAGQVRRVYQGEQFAACWQHHSAGLVYLIHPPDWNIPAPSPAAFSAAPWAMETA